MNWDNWPPGLVEAFKKKNAEFWNDPANDKAYENPSDFRVARVGNLQEELEFQKKAERGCCGSFEIEWDLCGVKLRYGFSYGH